MRIERLAAAQSKDLPLDIAIYCNKLFEIFAARLTPQADVYNQRVFGKTQSELVERFTTRLKGQEPERVNLQVIVHVG